MGSSGNLKIRTQSLVLPRCATNPVSRSPTICKNKPNRWFEGPKRGPLGKFENTNPMGWSAALRNEPNLPVVDGLAKTNPTADSRGPKAGGHGASLKIRTQRLVAAPTNEPSLAVVEGL